VINIHDVALAQRFVQRVIGLRAGRVVYDGAPDGLTPEVLTSIYGEEDWTEAKEDDALDVGGTVTIDRDRLQSV
jgi:phosphonate transport system ATP-binding protein